MEPSPPHHSVICCHFYTVSVNKRVKRLEKEVVILRMSMLVGFLEVFKLFSN